MRPILFVPRPPVPDEAHMVTTTSDRAIEAHRVALASAIGTTIEWYDFFIYGTAAAVVFAPQFFPQVSSLAGVLASFATFAVGFLARPLGGIVMGHFGDRIGRKSTLVWCLLLMGVSTFGIGILPNYSRLGVWAPLSLVFFRFVQGFTLGGEWGGAVLMSVEDAPQSKRGLFGSFVALGLPAGIILSNVVFLIASTIVTPEQFADVGLAHTIPCERSISGNRVVRPCKDRGKSRICQGIYIGPQAAAFAELFPPAVRYSGASLSITIGTVIGGAIAPFVATALYSTTGNSWPVTVYAVALSIISWLCALALTEGPSTTATPNVMLN